MRRPAPSENREVREARALQQPAAMQTIESIAPIELDRVLGGRGWGKLVRDVATAGMEYFSGEQVKRIEQPNMSSPPGIHDTRPPPQPPAGPNGVRIPSIRR
jgi:hypothetical protein